MYVYIVIIIPRAGLKLIGPIAPNRASRLRNPSLDCNLLLAHRIDCYVYVTGPD